MRWLLAPLLFIGAAFAQNTGASIQGLDHIPVVVSDLAEAQAHFRAMGFALKPGRTHPDGIENAHAKFPDGTEIELITAPKAVDALTAEYRAKLRISNGPVYFGLYVPDRAAFAPRLRALGFAPLTDDDFLEYPARHPLHPLFFGMRNKSPTDRPEYFAHSNGALHLSALWVRDIPAFHQLLEGLRVPLKTVAACAPIGRTVAVADLPEGQVMLVPEAKADVVGARVEVRDVSAVERLFTANHVPHVEDARCDPHSIWVPPGYGEGVWLQFSEVRS